MLINLETHSSSISCAPIAASRRRVSREKIERQFKKKKKIVYVQYLHNIFNILSKEFGTITYIITSSQPILVENTRYILSIQTPTIILRILIDHFCFTLCIINVYLIKGSNMKRRTKEKNFIRKKLSEWSNRVLFYSNWH